LFSEKSHESEYPLPMAGDIFADLGENEGEWRDFMKREEKRPIVWEVKDPKPPVVQSSHGDSMRQYDRKEL
jgi:hypothetical protein